ncbi:hypothetical protein ABZ566_24265, partial [Streptomyces hygroscopicus]|uniref:SRPBCC family protein n=1 Tax=Streptomyces hygroscopicus TaxID=1912 RepID=UPI0033F5EDF9
EQDRRYFAITVRPQVFVNLVPDHVIIHRMFPRAAAVAAAVAAGAAVRAVPASRATAGSVRSVAGFMVVTPPVPNRCRTGPA